MSTKVKLVKRVKANESSPVVTKTNVTEQQRNRAIVGVIKSWIDEFKLDSATKSEKALALLSR